MGIIILIIIIIVLFPLLINGQTDCSKAPSSIRKFCESMMKWDKNARASPKQHNAVALPPAIPGLLGAADVAGEVAQVPTTPYQCMDLGCLCNYYGGTGQTGTNKCSIPTLKKSIRKEYRMLSDQERARFHAAYKTLKTSGEFNRFATIHSQYAESSSAHAGPGFLPWHREFVKRFEFAIKKIDSSVNIPYWDSTLDGVLPSPKDSVMFTNFFMGTTDSNGNLTGGDFAGWSTINGNPNVNRSVGTDGSCYNESDIQWLMRQTDIELVLGYPAPEKGCTAPNTFYLPEFTHGQVHTFIGGDMSQLETSANDPIFFVFHAFVDMIWELWRINKQSRDDRETSYPMDKELCAIPEHFASAKMRPFEPLNNIDGCSNKYTDNLYEYAPRPTCALGPNCGSKWLFCDRSVRPPRCAAKIRIGGNCTGFNGREDVCIFGVCRGKICVQTRPAKNDPYEQIIQRPPKYVDSVACYNEHECCSYWSNRGECQKNPNYMNAWCKPSCRKCQPNYNLQIECNDRHINCKMWANQGECQNNKFWMTENCRQSCQRCQISREQICSGGKSSQPYIDRVTQRPPIEAKCQSPGCFNEMICCQLWGAMGECRKNQIWMNCNCRVSCGMCYSNEYNYGSCTDYHNQCRYWASQGECNKNGWMLENCKYSCNTCVSFNQLRQLCRGHRYGSNGRKKRDINSISSIGFPPSIEIDDVSFTRIVREANIQQHISNHSIDPSKDDHAEKLIKSIEKIPESSGMPST